MSDIVERLRDMDEPLNEHERLALAADIERLRRLVMPPSEYTATMKAYAQRTLQLQNQLTETAAYLDTLANRMELELENDVAKDRMAEACRAMVRKLRGET